MCPFCVSYSELKFVPSRPCRGVGGKPKIVAKHDPSVSNSAWESVFRWTWTSILLPENWVSWISPNIWRDTVSKWTCQLLKEGKQSWKNPVLCMLGLSSTIIRVRERSDQESSPMKRLPWRMSTIEHRWRQLVHAKSPVSARGVSAIRPGSFFF